MPVGESREGPQVSLQGWKDLDLDLMEGFEKGLGGHALPCKGGKYGAKVLVMSRLEKGSKTASRRAENLPFPTLWFCFLLKPHFLQFFPSWIPFWTPLSSCPTIPIHNLEAVILDLNGTGSYIIYFQTWRLWLLNLFNALMILSPIKTMNMNNMLPSNIYVLLDDFLYSPNRTISWKLLTSGSAWTASTTAYPVA